jgi:hypothetical protein
MVEVGEAVVRGMDRFDAELDALAVQYHRDEEAFRERMAARKEELHGKLQEFKQKVDAKREAAAQKMYDKDQDLRESFQEMWHLIDRA